jgi:phosphate/sulfate permease
MPEMFPLLIIIVFVVVAFVSLFVATVIYSLLYVPLKPDKKQQQDNNIPTKRGQW